MAEDLGVPVAQVVKAMLVQRSTLPGDGSSPFVLFVIPGNRRLSLKKAGAALADKKVQLASQRDVERVTGFQVGAVSVVGFPREDVPYGRPITFFKKPDRIHSYAGSLKVNLIFLKADDILRADSEISCDPNRYPFYLGK